MDQFEKQMQQFDALPQQQKLRRLQGFDDDSMQAFGQQYANWRSKRQAKVAATKTDQSAPGFYQGSPSDLARPPSVTSGPKSTGIAAKVRAAGGAATAGLLPYAADVAQQVFGGDQAPIAQIGSGKWQDQYKRDVEQNVGSAFAGGIAGGIAVPTPASAIRGVGGAIGTGVRALQGAMFGGAGAGSAGSDIETGAAVGGAAGVGVPLVASSLAAVPGAVQQFLVGKLAPSAMNMVRSMAQSILTAKGTPQAYGQLLKTPSKLGLGSRWDDMLYYVVNKLKPEILQPIAQRNARLAQQVAQAGKRVGQIKQPMLQTQVPAQALSRDIQGVARRLQTDMSSKGGVGPQAAQVVRNQYLPTIKNIVQAQQPSVVSLQQLGGRTATPQNVTAKLGQQLNIDDPSYGYIMPPPASGTGKLGKFYKDPTTGNLDPRSRVVPRTDPKWTNDQIAQAPQYRQQIPSQLQVSGLIKRGQPAKVPLSQLENRRIALEGSQYKPGTQISTPQAAVTRANQLIQDYTLRKAGYSDLARSRLSQAGDQYHIANKTLDVLSQHGQPGQGMTANTPWGQALGFVGQSIKQRGAPILMKPAQAISSRAINLVNKWGRQSGQFVPTDIAQKAPFLPPSQKAELVRKFQAIAEMRPQDAKVYAFAQSMANPMFRQFWMLAQKEQQGNE